MRETGLAPSSAKAQTAHDPLLARATERAGEPASSSLSVGGGNQVFLNLLGRLVIQPKLRIGQVGDQFEQQADRAAALVVSGEVGDGRAVALSPTLGQSVQRCGKCGGTFAGKQCSACKRAEEERSRRHSRATDESGARASTEAVEESEQGTEAAAVPAAVEQAAPPTEEGEAPAAGEAQAGERSPDQAESSQATAAASPLVVDDTIDDLSPQQMKKTDFLDALRGAVCGAVDEALSGSGRDSKGCPHVQYWFGYLAGKSTTFIERGIQRYAPDARNATAAADYIPAVADRVRRSTELWARTGEVVGVPEEFAGMLGVPANDEAATRIQFKARSGGAETPDDLSALRADLGDGEALNGGVRSRMESAFGVGFGHVRVHTDPAGAHLSDQLNARAFTVGEHVAFGPGEYRPGTIVGDALIAHELAHVVQQTGTHANASAGASAAPALEADADRSAVGAVTRILQRAGGATSAIFHDAIPRLRSGIALQRCSSKKTKCEIVSGPSYTPTGTIPVTLAGGRKKAAQWQMAAQFRNDASRDVAASACEVRQYIKWDAAFGQVPHSGFPAGSSADTWYEDRDTAGTRYGHRSGSYSAPMAGCFDEYLTGTTRDQANGDKYCGKDAPEGFSTDTGSWQFQLKVLDVANGDAEKGSSSVITVNW